MNLLLFCSCWTGSVEWESFTLKKAKDYPNNFIMLGYSDLAHSGFESIPLNDPSVVFQIK